MLKRLLVGLVLGVVLGAAAAAVLVQGLHQEMFDSPVYAYLAAIVTGVVTGLVAGKPIWSADGRIEAGLKAFFGGLLALGGMFAIRQWVKVDVNLDMLKAGHGQMGFLPAASLPAIAGVLAAFFELDNTPEAKDDAKGKGGSPKSLPDKKVRVAKDEDAAADDEDEEPASAAKKKR